jgi:hypothetical protein
MDTNISSAKPYIDHLLCNSDRILVESTRVLVRLHAAARLSADAIAAANLYLEDARCFLRQHSSETKQTPTAST